MTQIRKAIIGVMLSIGLPLFAQTPAPAAPAQDAAQAQVVRWQAGGATEAIKKDQLKVLTANDVRVEATVVNFGKVATVARVQITNTSPAAVDTSVGAFSVEILKPKPQTAAPVPADALAKKIKKDADLDAEAQVQSHSRSLDYASGGNYDESARKRLAGFTQADYVTTSAFPASVQPNFQSIGHVYFPFLKADQLVLRIKLGDTTYEFPFDKKEIRTEPWENY